MRVKHALILLFWVLTVANGDPGGLCDPDSKGRLGLPDCVNEFDPVLVTVVGNSVAQRGDTSDLKPTKVDNGLDDDDTVLRFESSRNSTIIIPDSSIDKSTSLNLWVKPDYNLDGQTIMEAANIAVRTVRDMLSFECAGNTTSGIVKKSPKDWSMISYRRGGSTSDLFLNGIRVQSCTNVSSIDSTVVLLGSKVKPGIPSIPKVFSFLDFGPLSNVGFWVKSVNTVVGSVIYGRQGSGYNLGDVGCIARPEVAFSDSGPYSAQPRQIPCYQPTQAQLDKFTSLTLSLNSQRGSNICATLNLDSSAGGLSVNSPSPGCYIISNKCDVEVRLSGPKGTQYIFHMNTQISSSASWVGTCAFKNVGDLAPQDVVYWLTTNTALTSQASVFGSILFNACTGCVALNIQFPIVSNGADQLKLKAAELIVLAPLTTATLASASSPSIYGSEYRSEQTSAGNASFSGIVDDLSVFSDRLSQQDVWDLFIEKPAYEFSNLKLWVEFDKDVVGVNNSWLIPSNLGKPLTIQNTVGLSKMKSARQNIRRDFNWGFRCRSKVQNETLCHQSCILGMGSLSCSGDKTFCDTREFATSAYQIESNKDPSINSRIRKPSLCVEKINSDCQCELINSVGSVTTGVTNSLGYENLDRDKFSKTFPESHLDFFSGFKDTVSSCLQEGYNANCFKTGSGRRLLSDGGQQFKIQLNSAEIKVTQDLSTRSCLECNERTVYFMKLEINTKREDILFSGLFSTSQLPRSIREESGTLSVKIEDGAGTDLLLEFVQFQSSIESEDDGCWMCERRLHKLANWNSFLKLASVLLIMISIWLAFRILMSMMKAIMMMARLCSAFAEETNMFCCCKVVSRRVKVANENIRVVAKKTYERANSEEKSDIESPEPVYFPDRLKTKTNKQRVLNMFVSILCFATLVDGCDNGLFVSVETKSCDRGKNCSVGIRFTGSIPSGGKTLCLEIGNKTTGVFLGKLEFNLVKEPETQPYDFWYCSSPWDGLQFSNHICGGHSTCSSIGTDVGPNDDPDGMFSKADGRLMKNPGYSRARGACGCISCDSCFLCSRSCTYTRYSINIKDKIPKAVFGRAEQSSTRYHLESKFYGENSKSEHFAETIAEVNQIIEGELRGSKTRTVIQGSINSNSVKKKAPEVVVYGFAGAIWESGLPSSCEGPFCQLTGWTTKFDKTSLTNKPAKSNLGDIQSKFFARTLDDFVFSPDIATISEGKIYDNVVFSKNGYDLVKSSEDSRDIFGQDYDGWEFRAQGKDDTYWIKESPFATNSILITFETDQIFELAAEKNQVCPKITSVGDGFYGKWGSDDGCKLRFSARSDCKEGTAIMTISNDQILLLNHTVYLTTDNQDFVLNALCSSPISNDGNLKICWGSDCGEVEYSDSSLENPGDQIDGFNDHTSGTVIVNGDESSSAVDFDDFFSKNNILSGILRLFASIIGGDGLLSAIVGFMITVVVCILGYYSIKQLTRVMSEWNDKRKIKKRK